jgi:hypothetical protein
VTACAVVLAGYAALMVAAVRFNRAERRRQKNADTAPPSVSDAGPSIPADRHGRPAVSVALAP